MGCSRSRSTADDPLVPAAAMSSDKCDGIVVGPADKQRALHAMAVQIEKKIGALMETRANAQSKAQEESLDFAVEMLQHQLVEVLREAGHVFRDDTEERMQIYAAMAVLAASVVVLPPEYANQPG